VIYLIQGDKEMTYQDKVYSRELVLHEFEVAVDIYMKSDFLTNDDKLELIKKKHIEITAKLEKIHSDYLSAPKAKDPFVD
jgi:hypothetical protein